MASKGLKTVRFKKVGDVMHKNVATIDGKRDRDQRYCDDATEEGLQPGGQSKDPRRCLGDRDSEGHCQQGRRSGKGSEDVKVHEIMTKPVDHGLPGSHAEVLRKALSQRGHPQGTCV